VNCHRFSLRCPSLNFTQPGRTGAGGPADLGLRQQPPEIVDLCSSGFRMPKQHLAESGTVNTVIQCIWQRVQSGCSSSCFVSLAIHDALDFKLTCYQATLSLFRHCPFSGTARNNAKEYLSIQRYSKYLFGHRRPGHRCDHRHSIKFNSNWSKITLMLCLTDRETALKLVERMSPGWLCA